MNTGKLPKDVMNKMLAKIHSSNPRVILGPALGEDAAIISMENRNLVVSSDPITFTSTNIGWYSVHINANDIATRGAKPLWFLATILAPPNTHESSITNVISEIKKTCNSLNIELVGGHTEITESVTNLIVSGTMLGETINNSILRSSNINAGDSILLTKHIGIEGTGVLAHEFENTLMNAGMDKTLIDRAQNFIFEPGLSVIKEALYSMDNFEIKCMHDPTEGGLSAALVELSEATNKQFIIEEKSIPISTITTKICDLLNINPLGILSSGCLLIFCKNSDAEDLKKDLETNNIPTSIIGKVVEGNGVKLIQNGIAKPIPEFERDEIAKYMSQL
jgi:hydrogenase expression/formation protein HypE